MLTKLQVYTRTRTNEEVYKTLAKCLRTAGTRHGGSYRHFASDGVLQLEFAPMINRIISPPLRPVNKQVVKPEERKNIGTVILRNAEKKSDNNWAGSILDPRDGKVYTGKVKLEKANELTLSGCLLGFLCKGETWSRDPDQKLASTPGGKPVGPAFKDTAAK